MEDNTCNEKSRMICFTAVDQKWMSPYSDILVYGEIEKTKQLL
jgi:hypothetical protein